MQTDEQMIEAMARAISHRCGLTIRASGVAERAANDCHTIAKAHWEARVEAEREAAANIAAGIASPFSGDRMMQDEHYGYIRASNEIATAIRNLEQGEGR